jgi:hypothetical protein
MIKVNNKEVTNPIAQIFWGTFAILITWWVFFLVGVIFFRDSIGFYLSSLGANCFN